MAKWTYKAVEIQKAYSAGNIQKLLDKESQGGWEYMNPVSYFTGGFDARTYVTLIFRREQEDLIDDAHPSG